MSLIIKDKIPMLKIGYPTVSDKYNVAGGILAGSTPAKFGALVKYSATKGYYEAISGAVTVADIAGFTLATNVKLAEEWPGKTVQINPGEAFNLVLPGSYLAVELIDDADEDEIAANKPVAMVLADGTLTTSAASSVSTQADLPFAVFTGTYEKHGTKIVAEVYVK